MLRIAGPGNMRDRNAREPLEALPAHRLMAQAGEVVGEQSLLVLAGDLANWHVEAVAIEQVLWERESSHGLDAWAWVVLGGARSPEHLLHDALTAVVHQAEHAFGEHPRAPCDDHVQVLHVHVHVGEPGEQH